MDNRRVSKAYRDRSRRATVLPYPQQAGLLSKVKRFFSNGLGLYRAILSGASTPALQGSERPMAEANNLAILPDSFVAANASLVQGSEDSNRVLSSFFQAKGNAPLSQVEYEGVMLLLDRSRANITLPAESTSPPPLQASNSVARANNTFAPYLQKKLRTASAALDVNSSSLIASEFKPVYHTFSNTSHASLPKRVYPLKPLPSTRTRIKAPDFAARRASRNLYLTPAIANSLNVNLDLANQSSSTLLASEPRTKSKTASALLLALEANDGTDSDTASETVRPLHNPYARKKKPDAAKRFAPLSAADISKTIAFSKADELPEPVATLPSPGKTTKGFGLPDEPELQANGVALGSHTIGDGPGIPEKEAEKTLGANEQKAPFKFGTSAAGKPDQTLQSTFDEKPRSLFGSGLESDNEPSKLLFGSKPTASQPAFTFGTKLEDVPVAAESISATPVMTSGRNSESDKTASSVSETAPQSLSKPTFNFGQKPETPSLFNSQGSETPKLNFGKKSEEASSLSKNVSSEAPKFSFGQKTEATPSLFKDSGDDAPKFSFGKKPEETLKSQDTETPRFGFGQKSEDAPSLFKSQGGETAKFSFGKKPEETTEAPKFSFGKKSEEPTEAPKFSFGKKPEESTETPKFSFGKKPEETTETPKFSFGKKPEETTKSKDSETPKFNFGQQTQSSASDVDAKPSFSFGQKPQSDKPTLSFGGAQNKDKKANEASTPLFSFGKPAESKPTEPTSLFAFGAQKEEPKKQAFSFGAKPSDVTDEKSPAKEEAPKSAFGFGSTSEVKADEEKPKSAFGFGSTPSTFSFGQKPEKATAELTQKTPLTFGSQPKPVAEASADDSAPPASKPAFSFGQKPEATNEVNSNGFQATAETSKPSFGFGQKSEITGQPAFKFGATTSSDEQSKAGFGGSSDAKPGFKFGETTASNAKPAFNFGASSASGAPSTTKFGEASNTSAQPTFKFGESSSTGAQPFKFGDSSSTSAQPAFKFGASKEAEGAEQNADAVKPAFGFPKQSADQPAPAFLFTKPTTDTKPAFSFGQQGTSATPALFGGAAIGAPAFSFGTKFGAEQKNGLEKEAPAFNFGLTPNSTAPKPFTFGSAPGGLSSEKTGNGLSHGEFDFGEVPVMNVTVNPAEVEEYENVYKF